MPKLLQYRANSVIYFEGDAAEKIFLLQAGSVKLLHVDIESGKDVSEPLSKGEFFGVKSALGHYPREEDAIVAQDSTVLAFSVSEFEDLATKNALLILKMLKVFSNQMRRTHKQVASLMNNAESQNQKPEDGLYQLGKFYFKNKKYAYTQHIYSKYLTYYPDGAYVDTVRTDLNAAVSFIARYGDGLRVKKEADPPPDKAGLAGDASDGLQASLSGGDSDPARRYNEAMELVSQKSYIAACQVLKKLADGGDSEFAPKSSFEIGHCLFLMGKYNECIKYYTQIITKYPKHASIGEALFFMGQACEGAGDDTLAMEFYKKSSLAAIPQKDDGVSLKAVRALKRLQGLPDE
ncbi:MAG: cyclic nucleotide-binding domain-containing protein [Treponema sp.]|jgi:CRP-like cAMP-binding protein|nr:cyclic nucleotide-binding domain-containing protein [Treponema sp.]